MRSPERGLLLGGCALALAFAGSRLVRVLPPGGRSSFAVAATAYLLLAALLFAAGEAPVLRDLARPRVGAVLGGLAAGLAVAALLLAATSRHGASAADPRLVAELGGGTGRYRAAVLLLALAAAPVVEEWLFRGVVLQRLRPYGRGTALLLSAALFAAWHMQAGALAYYLAVGLLLGLAYLRWGLPGSVPAHVGFNLVLGLLAYRAG